MVFPLLRLFPFLSKLSPRPSHAINTLRIPPNCLYYGTRSSTSRSLHFPSRPSLTVPCLAVASGITVAVLWFTEKSTRVACEEKESEGTFAKWKQNKIGRYENRLRVYSHPLKVFKYFASVMQRDSSGNPVYYMTPQDFVRSLLPFNEVDGDVRAHGGGLGVTVFHKDHPSTDMVKPVKETKCKELDEALDFFKLADTDGDGLISYQEYVFFLAILSIPENQFDIAFKVFDEDCNGSIDIQEFSRFVSATKPPMLAQIGARESLNGPVSSSTPSVLTSTSPAAPIDLIPTALGSSSPSEPNAAPLSSNLGVMNYLFGQALDKKISIGEFTDFLRDFRKQILKLEFFGCGYAVDSRDSSISAKDFATIVISYADYRRLEEYAKHVNGLETWEARVSFAEFVEFDKIMQKIDDIALAIRLYNQANMATSTSSIHGFNSAELLRAIKSATGSQLSPTQIKIIYHIFDRNGDGFLDSEEFLDVLKGRRNRGLDQPRDFGFVRYIKAMYKCAVSGGAAL